MLVPRAGAGARTRARSPRWSGSRPSRGWRRSPATATRCGCASTTAGSSASAAAALEAGEALEGATPTSPPSARYAVYFWGANTTKALHIGHLRNLAIGNAIGAALEQAGARVEHRSLICDVGRSMGEAMAGVVASGGEQQRRPEGDEKSDHFVGACYADYVKASRDAGGGERATTAPRTRSRASPRCTTTRPTS